MKHIDLFSGIGGFALAVDTVWPNSEHIFCEIDPFCTQVLKKHWPQAQIYGDIRTITNTRGKEPNRVSDQQGQEISKTWDLLTGGFPCQPFSQAGRRKGTSDDRYLWPEMFRVIREFKPTWVIAENVRGLVTWNEGMVLEQVCSDLESEGYEVQPLIIPAVAVNAPHRRDRVWFVGYSKAGSDERHERKEPGEDELGRAGSVDYHEEKTNWDKNWLEVAAELCGVFNGVSRELDEVKLEHYAEIAKRITGQDLPCLWDYIQSEAFQWSAGRFNAVQNKDYLFTVLWQLAHRTDGQNHLSFESAEVQEAYVRNVWYTKETGCPSSGWKYNEQYAEEHKDTLSQLSYEIALVAKESKDWYEEDRKERLKSLGNAIVPHVAIEIMRAICGKG